MTDDLALLQATSAGVATDGTTFVVFGWEAVDGIVGYHLLRRTVGGSSGPLRRVNGQKPITPPTSARQLRAIITEASPEWTALREGFGEDPAVTFDRGLTDREMLLVRAAAQASLPMSHAAGLAYTDRSVVADEHYLYELRGVTADGVERRLAVDVPVWAGHFTPPNPPSGVTTQAGDRRVLVLWNRNPYAATFVVQRATSPGGPYQQVNPQPVAFDRDSNLDGSPLTPARPAFLDIGAWDPDGLATTHLVAGTAVSGPDNGITYWYQVASQDRLGRTGAWSAAVAATPVRSVPPMAPDSLQVSPTTTADGLAVTWRKATRNVENHQPGDTTQTNHVYRAETRDELEDLASLSGYLVATVLADPSDATIPTLSWTDLDPILVPPYGTKPFFYRVQVVDAYGIVGAPSAVISGTVPDTTPPGPTAIIDAIGEPDRIRVDWKPNTEPDLAGYQIYRSVCDHGFVYVPGIAHIMTKGGKVVTRGESKEHCDMTLVGDVPLGDAKAMQAANNRIWFEDTSVPEGSPLCYAYWVRAYDQAGNLYPGHNGCPASPAEYRCARLREKTPPPVPVMTGLKARNHGVLIEWASAPVQDLHAFHVYRADAEFDPPKFLACVFTDGTISSVPWGGLVPSCDDVPAALDPLAAKGSYLDPTPEPHGIYCYRVSALDWLGNESDGSNLTDIPADSTFTYTSDLPVTPNVLPPGPSAVDGCGLAVSWAPAFEPNTLRGFVVFRAAANGPYRQVSAIVGGNAFADVSARRGVDYFYCVQSIDRSGSLSRPSLPVLHRY
jgi:hypothetical protein